MNQYLTFTVTTAVEGVLLVAVVAVVAYAFRWQHRQTAAIQGYRKRLAYRDARVREDAAWRNEMRVARAAAAHVRELELADLLGAGDLSAADPVDVLWAEHDEPLRLIEGGVPA